MARVTVEDCLRMVDNRFSLVHLTAKRVRQLREGAPAYVDSKNKEVVVALREIASGEVFPVSRDEAEAGRRAAEEEERRRMAEAAAAVASAAANRGQDDDEDDDEDDEPA